jgi:hypothetical protein
MRGLPTKSTCQIRLERAFTELRRESEPASAAASTTTSTTASTTTAEPTESEPRARRSPRGLNGQPEAMSGAARG